MKTSIHVVIGLAIAWVIACGSSNSDSTGGSGSDAGDDGTTGSSSGSGSSSSSGGGTCGAPGQACCPGATCSMGNVCQGGGVGGPGTCAPCGTPGNACCDSNACGSGGCCDNGTCIASGSTCPGLTGTCSGGSCGKCGGAGQACCMVGMDGGSCTAGGVQCSGGTCTSAYDGSDGMVAGDVIEDDAPDASTGCDSNCATSSAFLDPTRTIDWTGTGFTIPSYTANCATQPTLTANSQSADAANATSIQNALASCDATHNVVNIPAGTYYFTSVTFGSQGHQVLRGAGPNLTTIIPTAGVGCAGGITNGLCLIDANDTSSGNPDVLPGGKQACSWTAGYAQGTTTITLSNCGGAPPTNGVVILDQANDISDTNGVFVCDTNIANCGIEGTTGGNNNGRSIAGVTHSQQQVTQITGVTSLGAGSYSVTVSPGVYFTNVRASQSPGAWWFDVVQNDGVENLTIDGSTMGSGHPTDFGNIGMYQCYECWVKNVRSENAGRYHVEPFMSFRDVIRDSYFYGALGGASQSYGIEFETASGVLVENNILQQTTAPIMVGAGTGNVIAYNLSLDNYYTGGSGQFAQSSYFSHNAGNEMSLYEGNDMFGIWGDDSWGSSAQDTIFRNQLLGWYSGKTESTLPVAVRSRVRAINVVGNVLGQPGYHNQYQAYATSTSGGVGGNTEATSIYSLGWVTQDGACSGGALNNSCDPSVLATLMRWGNYDTVTMGVKWDAAEASPGAVPYVNANFTSSYFASLPQTLPASLYYPSKPSWWPAAKAWPAIGPDVSSGNLGTCSGTYAGAQATASSQCSGGSWSSAWGAHATSIPAHDCYLNVMQGPPDGTGSVLSFDASACY